MLIYALMLVKLINIIEIHPKIVFSEVIDKNVCFISRALI